MPRRRNPEPFAAPPLPPLTRKDRVLARNAERGAWYALHHALVGLINPTPERVEDRLPRYSEVTLGPRRATATVGSFTLHGPEAPPHRQLAALRELAAAVLNLPDSAHRTPDASWRAAVSALRLERSAPGLRPNPDSGLPAGAGLGRLVEVGQALGLPAVADWMADNEAGLGPVLFGQGSWHSRHRSGWETWANAAGQGDQRVTRVDGGLLDPRIVLTLPPIPLKDALASGAPWAHWTRPEETGVPAALAGEDGEGDEAALAALKADRASLQPPVLVRTADGRLGVAGGRSWAAAAAAGGLALLPVRVVYLGGAEALGEVVQLATGQWAPIKPGARVLVVGGSWRTRSRLALAAEEDQLHEVPWVAGVVVGVQRHAHHHHATWRVRLDGETRARTYGLTEIRLLAPPDGFFLRENGPPARRTWGLEGVAVARGLLGLATWLAAADAEVSGLLELGSRRARPDGAHLVSWSPPQGAWRVAKADTESARPRFVGEVLLSDAVEVGEGMWVGLVTALDERPSLEGVRWVVKDSTPGRRAVLAHPSDPRRIWLTSGALPLGVRHQRLRRSEAPATADNSYLYDAEGRRYEIRYQVVEAATDGATNVIVSHRPDNLTAWVPGYPAEFQARDLGTPSESAKIQTIARQLDPGRLLGCGLEPTMGPPVAWEGPDGKLYVLAGNGRTIALMSAPKAAYAAYRRLGEKIWSAWPRDTPAPHHRWILLRVLVGASRAQAVQLAAASQASSAADETRIGRALSLMRSLELNVDTLPPIAWTQPVSAANVGEFASENQAFINAVLKGIDSARQASYRGDGDRLAPLVEAVLIGSLPAAVRRPGLFHDPKVEDAFLGALPGLVTLRTRVKAGELFPAFDLLSRLEDAVKVFAWLRKKRLSFNELNKQIAMERATVSIDGADRLSDTPDLALALAAALYNASRRTAPALVMAGFLEGYLGQASAFDPRQAGLFGAPSFPDPAGVLAGLIKGFELPPKRNPDTGSTHNRLLKNPGPDNALIAVVFDREYFSAAQALQWLKGHTHRALEVQPHPWGLVVFTDPDNHRLPRKVREVPVTLGVWALIH